MSLKSRKFRGNSEITEFDEFELFTGVTELDNIAFDECRNLRTIKLPATIKSIANGNWQTNATFRYCTSLTCVDLPDGLESIGSSAFFGCTGINHFIIPGTVNYLSQQVFNRNVDLGTMEYFIIKAGQPPLLQDTNCFDHTDNCPIYVPDDSLAFYQSATNWARLANRIKPISEFQK